jgi:plastocyanin
MTRHSLSVAVVATALVSLGGVRSVSLAGGPAAGLLAAGGPAGGSVTGRVRLTGKPPANALIRMGVDPMCSRANGGKRVMQETVVTDKEGGLANVFVRVAGKFSQTPVPSQPVVIDQRGCVYVPRVVGVRVGQTLQVRNSDPLLHNVHSVSTRQNAFNVGQPVQGMTNDFRLKDEEVMLPIKCDVHRWMTSYVGVVQHPYFAVTDREGRFTIADVPPGSYTLETWHEQYGTLTQPLRVKPGATATPVDFSYTGTEKPPKPSK